MNDIPRTGDFHTFNFIGESIVVVCGRDGVPRAFSNVCLHRAARLVDGPTGQCGRIVCPYHAWTYDLEGRLIGVPLRETYPDLCLGERRLPPIELEVFKGFIFVRLASGGPTVVEMMAPYADELEPYRFEALQPSGRVTLDPAQSTGRPSAITWQARIRRRTRSFAGAAWIYRWKSPVGLGPVHESTVGNGGRSRAPGRCSNADVRSSVVVAAQMSAAGGKPSVRVSSPRPMTW